MSVAKHLHRVLFLLAISVVAPAALAQTFTYTYFPSSTTINTPVTTDFAIVGFSGGQYNEDTFAREFTGPSSPTVTIANGADIPEADIFNSSVVNITGGTAALFPFDHSTVNIHGGTVPFALTFENSVVNMYAGAAGDLEGQGHQVNVFGGTVGTLVANGNTDYLGNTIGSCEANVFGGSFSAGNDLTAFNEGVLNIHGGLIQSAFIRAAEGGTLNIYGTNLAAQLINPHDPNGYSIYHLAGLLADGSPISGLEMRIRNDGVTYGHSTFNLINVPAPGAAGVLAMGGVLAPVRRRAR
jgi:hypothetical protein